MARDRLQQREQLWNRVSDAVLLVGLWAVLLLFGGRHPWGHTVLIVVSLAAAGLMIVRRMILTSGNMTPLGLGWLALAGVSIPLLQIIPLPETWLSLLSPQLRHILPAWNETTTAGTLGAWRCVSLAPAETQTALSLWLAYCLVFFYVIQRIEDIEDVERILRWFVPIVLGLSVFGLLQYLFSNNKFFWFYEHPFAKTSDALKASFTNRNHFADLVALAVGPLLWWSLADRPPCTGGRRATVAPCEDPLVGSDGTRKYLRCFSLPLVLLALLLTQSRGGTLAAIIALVTVGIALFHTGWLKAQWLGAFVLGLVFLMTAVLIVGTDTIAGRWEGLVSLSWEQLDRGEARRTVWQNTWRASHDFWPLGSGCGSFSVVYPLYQPERSTSLYYTHAENGYLQVLLETGLPGALLILLTCLALVRWAWQAWRVAPTPRHRAATGAVAAGLAAFAFHGLVDYVWYVPGLAAVVAILMACLVRLDQMTRSGVQQGTAPTTKPLAFRSSGLALRWTLPIVAFILSAAWQIPAAQRSFFAGIGEFSWHRYLALYRTADWPDMRGTTQSAVASDLASPEDEEPTGSENHDSFASETSPDSPPTSPRIQEEQPASLATEGEMIKLLFKVIRRDPTRAEAHLRLAKAYLRMFHLLQEQSENPMPLSQIRDAVLLSQFSSQEELDRWLQTAIGDHITLLHLAKQESLAAVRLCPLLGEGYFILGQLSFLNGGREEGVMAWFRQALAVRPCDGELLFRVGAELALTGHYQEALELWRRAFRCGRLYQIRLLDRLIGSVPPEEVDQESTYLVETFEPDLEMLRYMYRQYRKRYPIASLDPLRRAYAVALTSQLRDERNVPSRRAELWLELHFLHLDGGDIQAALQCAEEAVRCNPLDYRAHHYLSLRLEEMGRFAEAEEQVRWCLQRRPGHRSLQNRLHNLYQKRMKAEDEARSWRMAEAVSPGNSPPNR